MSVVWRPPPTHENCPPVARAEKPSVTGLPAPQTNFGRIETVAKSSRVRVQHEGLLLRLDRAVRRRRVRPQRRRLVDIDERVAGQQRGLAATVDEAGNLGIAGDLQRGPGAVDGHQLVSGEVGVQISLGGQVEQHLAARHRIAPGVGSVSSPAPAPRPEPRPCPPTPRCGPGLGRRAPRPPADGSVPGR